MRDKSTPKSFISQVVIAIIIGSFFGVMVGEGCLRLVLDEVNYLKPELRPHRVLGHTIVPGSGGHDAWGFRNKHVPQAAEIVAIGDSMTYGESAPAAKSWPAWLQTLSGRSVYNLALGGYAPPEYKYLLQEYGLSLAPKIAIFGVYFGNDLPRSYMYKQGLPSQTVEFKEWEQSKRNSKGYRLFGNLRNWLSHHSLLYQVTKHELPIVIDWLRFKEAQWANKEDFFMLDHSVAHTVFAPTSRFLAMDQRDARNRAGLSAMLEIFDEIQTICKDQEIRCIFLLLPTKESVYWPFAKVRLTGRGYDTLAATVEQEAKVREQVKQHCDQRGLEYVDALPTMRASAAEHPLYAAGPDTHPNGTGHRAIATVVLQKIQNAGPSKRS